MSSSSRRAFLGLSLPLLLAGCFKPMLARDSDAGQLQGQIALPDIDGRLGYFLYKSLEDRLGTPDAPEWRLTVSLNTSERGLAIAQDNAVTRISVTATADWALFAQGGSEPILRDREITESGYNATESLFATRQTRLDIERRLARDLGERISRALLAQASVIQKNS